ncbi:MAG: adenylate kinase [Tenuifilaceae bacterium]|nr:adenylate kinase [Tenuifilaceae bacterium]
MLNIVLFGPPGAGKGTQSQKIISKYNLKHLSTGDMLRSAIQRQTENGVEAQKFMDRGELAPDEIVIGIIGRCLDKYNGTANGFVFDGFPRTTVQAAELDVLVEQRNSSVSLMLGLEVEYDELILRLENRANYSGRADDADITIIKNRIDVYNQRTRPVMEFYKEQGKYVGIKGMGSVDEIFQRICNAVELVENR